MRADDIRPYKCSLVTFRVIHGRRNAAPTLGKMPQKAGSLFDTFAEVAACYKKLHKMFTLFAQNML